MNETTKNRMQRGLVITLVFLGVSSTAFSAAWAAGSRHHQPERVVRELPHNQAVAGVRFSASHMDRPYYGKGPFGHVRPSLGTIVAALPAGFIRLTIGNAPYYLAGSVYYRPVARGYQVVTAPVEPAGWSHKAMTRVRVRTLNVRTGPARAYPVTCQMQRHDLLAVQGRAQGWIYVKLPDGRHGWVMERLTNSAR